MVTVRMRAGGDQKGFTLVEMLFTILLLAAVSTMIIIGWINMQNAYSYTVSSNHSRSTVRDAMGRISSEMRGAQPTSLPSASALPVAEPLLTTAAPMEVCFYSSFNISDANADGSGLAAKRLTRVWLDTDTVPSSPWNPAGRTLYLQRDMDGNGSFTDEGDRNIILARNVVNTTTADSINGTSYTPVFLYAYRPSEGESPEWIDNAGSGLDLSSVIAVRVRLIIDANTAHSPKTTDISTTIRLRNASSD